MARQLAIRFKAWLIVAAIGLGLVAATAGAQGGFGFRSIQNGIVVFSGTSVRFPNTTWILGRNAADTADVSMIRVAADNTVEVGAGVTLNGSLIPIAGFPNTFDLGSTSLPMRTVLAQTVNATGANMTAGSGTGVTINTAGAVQQQVYKVTVGYTNFVANAVTADVTLATLPAKTVVTHLLADLTATFVCAATCTTSTLSMTCGKTAGGNQYLLSFDADAAAAQFGDAAGELGASLAPATIATGIGDLGSWTGTTAAQCRLTSGTGALGNGSVTNLNAGSITFYLTTIVMP